jgi:aerobic-type carbon monoxide dehydrogenase small subunit (CoxS/CutS family)
MKPQMITLHINGHTHYVALAPNQTLLTALRDLGYTDVKCGCEKGDCGACAVFMDGVAVNSCLVLAWQADETKIVTAAGLGTIEHPHPLQTAFSDAGAIQCGYCTPGMIVAAKSLLDHNPHPQMMRYATRFPGTFAAAPVIHKSFKLYKTRPTKCLL